MNRIEYARRQGAAVVLLVGSLSLAAYPARGQEMQAANGPLLKVDLVRMLATGDYTTDEIVHIVRMNCVSFRPSERDRNDLRALPHGDPVLAEIGRCRAKGQAAGFERGIPRANPVNSTDSEPPSDEEALRVTRLSGDLLGERPAPAAPKFTMVLVERDHDALTAAEIPPKLQNWDEVSKQLLREYRPNERHAGTVVLRVRVDETGRAADSLLDESSGDPYLDAAVLATVPVMRFKPAMSRDRMVAAWTELPIQFETP
ncbi:MAG: energy transducer TonB [Candidatus Palauibacterales bacterium]|jgi:TonB family protein|nr:energy transducer TonB [Candidatus Palauibacterales bacterium]MDP2483064.1 energy transducer TonB [Candidatus Palauibacterales bacterium]